MKTLAWIVVLLLPPSAASFADTSATFSVVQSGAVADAKTDCTGPFQAAINAAAANGGGVVDVPAGLYRVSGTLRIPAYVTLQGVAQVAPTVSSTDPKAMSGSVLMAYSGRGKPDGPAFITLAGNCAGVRGLTITYPEWQQRDVPPVPYPPCVQSDSTENVVIENCCLVNPYDGIRLVRAHRHLVRNVTGYPSHRGIYVDECYDIGHIENVHYWPFGVQYKPDDKYCLWVNTQGVAFELARTDWHYVLNTFCFGYGVGYRFSESRNGSTNGNFTGLGADSCRRAVQVLQAQPAGLLITNGEFVGRWGSGDSVCVEVGPDVVGKVSLVNCSFWGPINRCIWMRSAKGPFSAVGCHFANWDVGGEGNPAIDLAAGRSVVSGCTFDQEGSHVRVGQRVRTALLTANLAAGGLTVVNMAGPRLVLSGNEVDPIGLSLSALNNYILSVGDEGDGRYLTHFHGRERVPVNGAMRSQRWSGPSAVITLPVNPRKAYTLTVHAGVTAQARSADSGIYLGTKRVISFASGEGTYRGTIPAQVGQAVRLEVRCRTWIPALVLKASSDSRRLGVSFYSVSMVSADGHGPAWSANTGLRTDEGQGVPRKAKVKR